MPDAKEVLFVVVHLNNVAIAGFSGYFVNGTAENPGVKTANRFVFARFQANGRSIQSIGSVESEDERDLILNFFFSFSG